MEKEEFRGEMKVLRVVDKVKVDMGCRLPKLRKAEDRQSPGKIYSTLRRPQVETKVGVAYTYHFLDFLLGKEEVPVSSVLCLSSVRELPVQVRELYAQGFVLVAVHPFVHPCGPRHAHIQRQLHRAVLVRETTSSEKSQLRWARHRLETDVCVAGHQAADPEMIQSYVKKVQDVAEQGVMFVGFLQQPGGVPYFLGNWDPEELSSLHSSPSPIHRHPFSANTSPTDPSEPHQNGVEADCHSFDAQDLYHDNVECNTQPFIPNVPDFSPLKPTWSSELNTEEFDETIQTSQIRVKESLESKNQPQNYCKPSVDTPLWFPSQNPADANGNHMCPSPSENSDTVRQKEHSVQDLKESTDKQLNPPNQKGRRGSNSDSRLSSPEPDHSHDTSDSQSRLTRHHNNNHIRRKSSEKDKNASSPPGQARMQLFALYNHTGELNTSLRFYSLRVPLQVQKEAGLITEVDAHWLDHMTQHFTNGAQLIDGFFHLGNDNGCRSEDRLHSITPVFSSIWMEAYVRFTNTNCQDQQMPNLRGRSKAKKNSAGEEERDSRSPLMETEMDRLRRNTREEEEESEGRKSWDSGRSERASPLRGGEEREEDASYQKGFSLLSGSQFSVEDQEEETDIDKIPPSKQQKTVRWTDVCQKDGGGVKEQVKTEERIKQQLFSGVC
ncbi:Raftlin Raft-linking protein [Channa argus]|uniref:Raftlin Raft-linking protein n=1 Tax=Channa argus TaxID=215402 RepID=A0A6G1QYI7_CHAAH|nr:Raftlin Raft-linking protein [Channa argus]